MDLGLRNTDSKILITTTTTTTSPDNYFSEQALRAGLMMNSDPLREAVQREHEKERIREEIIASEIIRRRELEAEVRREMAMERDLAIRRGEGFSLIATSSFPSLWSEPRLGMLDVPNGVGFGFPERLPPNGVGFGLSERFPLSARAEVAPFERLPFQRNLEAAKMAESNKGKVVLLAKPITANLAGTKRKLTAADSVNVSNITNLKKKPKEWSCALCEVTATSEEGLNMHFQGKKHKSKEARSSLPKKNKGLVSKKDKKLEVRDKKKLMTPDLKKKRFSFWCADCQVGCHSETVMNNHCKGRKHIMRTAEVRRTGCSGSSTTKNDDVREKEVASEEKNGDAKENSDKEVAEEEVEAGGQEEGTETMDSLVDEGAEVEASKD